MKTLLYTLTLLSGFFTFGQTNLVVNNSFESNTMLPNDGGQWYNCTGWNNCGGTQVQGYYGNPDYFHNNGSGMVQLPSTALAYVEPHTGDAVMGFLAYHESQGIADDIREYIGTELEQPLVVGQAYEVSFWITNGFSSIGHKYSCNHIGVNFSIGELSQNGTSYINDIPEVEIEGNQWSTEWELITLTFIAEEASTHLTIGNFYPDSDLNIDLEITTPVPFNGAYYFIDDVSVQRTSLANLNTNELGNPKELVKIVDLLGRPCSVKTNIPLIYIYDDGSTQKVFKTEL